MEQPTPANAAQDNASMTAWFDVGPVRDFAGDAQVCTTVAGKPIVIFNVDGELHAIANVCPHAGLPLGDGERRGMIITCPYHGYTYHIKNGRNIDWPHDEPPVKTYPVRVEKETVQVQMQKPKKEDDDTKRGPAPADTPDDEKGRCDPDRKEKDGPHAPDCPEGYPDRPPTTGRPA
ncbi:MAG: Rieske (2Fe-2S) protein [Phycisphaeraceae bacterium]